jgi:hypothetical protein
LQHIPSPLQKYYTTSGRIIKIFEDKHRGNTVFEAAGKAYPGAGGSLFFKSPEKKLYFSAFRVTVYNICGKPSL